MAYLQNRVAINSDAANSTTGATHWRLYDASTGGNILFENTLVDDTGTATTVTLTSNQYYQVAINGLSIQVPVPADTSTASIKQSAAQRCLVGVVSDGSSGSDANKTWFQLFDGPSSSNSSSSVSDRIEMEYNETESSSDWKINDNKQS